MAVRTDGDRAAVAQELVQREQPVTEVGFGTRTQAHDRAGGREALDFVLVHVGCVHEAPVPVDLMVLE